VVTDKALPAAGVRATALSHVRIERGDRAGTWAIFPAGPGRQAKAHVAFRPAARRMGCTVRELKICFLN
jgi:hypothetical protein